MRTGGDDRYARGRGVFGDGRVVPRGWKESGERRGEEEKGTTQRKRKRRGGMNLKLSSIMFIEFLTSPIAIYVL